MNSTLTTAQINAIANAVTTAVVAALNVNEPAKQTRTRKPVTRKAAPKKAAPKVTKGAQTRETLSRKDWNRTLTAKARFAGGSTYRTVLAQWADAQVAREAGFTPDEFLASF